MSVAGKRSAAAQLRKIYYPFLTVISSTSYPNSSPSSSSAVHWLGAGGWRHGGAGQYRLPGSWLGLAGPLTMARTWALIAPKLQLTSSGLASWNGAILTALLSSAQNVVQNSGRLLSTTRPANPPIPNRKCDFRTIFLAKVSTLAPPPLLACQRVCSNSTMQPFEPPPLLPVPP